MPALWRRALPKAIALPTHALMRIVGRVYRTRGLSIGASGLVRSEPMLNALGEATPDLLYVKDRKGRFLYANPAMLAAVGRSANEVIGWTIADLLADPAEAAEVLRGDRQVLAGRVPMTVEERVTDVRRGKVRVWESTKTPLFDPKTGELIGLVGISRDVTEASEAKQVLIQSEARLRELLRSIDLAAIYIREFKGRIRFWTAGCTRLYGWTAAEAIGRSALELLSTGMPRPQLEIDNALLSEGEWSGDLQHRRRDGQEITVAARLVLIRDSSGRPHSVMASLADVTVLRRTEEELRRLNEALESRVEAEVAARQAVHAQLAHTQRMEALGQLAGGIAHDFNNVLQAVLGGATLIQQRAGDAARIRRLAGTIMGAAERGLSVTQRLLVFSRYSDLRAEPVDVQALLTGLEEIFIHTLGRSIEVRLALEPDLPPLFADKRQLETAIINLATNARDAMEGPGVLTIAAALDQVEPEDHGLRPSKLPAGAYVRISVSDTGCGMDELTASRALEPFFSTKSVGHGTGLGLSMAQGFVEQSGGGLRIDSALGQGTTVTLWLPVSAEEFVMPADLVDDTIPNAPSGQQACVLLVDDEAPVREVISEHLMNAGYAVLPAASASQALALLDAGERVSLLLSDFSMQGMDGVSLIQEVHRRLPELPAILLTGFASRAAELSSTGRSDGRFSMLLKPVSESALIEHVRRRLAEPVGDYHVVCGDD